ncbi:carbohydrate-binding family 6 protein, partial [candidate division KSB1 bacterium]|nr:carbohydrate-binding family 6 protein [candidate division KSB1 bacterium]
FYVHKTGFDEFEKDTGRDRIVLFTLSNKSVKGKMLKEGAAPLTRLEPEGYSIRITGNVTPFTYWVVGADTAGLMYGGLELAEMIATGSLASIKEMDKNPYMAMRGVKFNIPLDVRTPSYSDVCDAAQNNIAEMWDFEFWREFIDHLALYRYNYISLWNLHPFPSLVRVPDYPDIALRDVQRSTVDWKEFYPLEGLGFENPEILENVEILKKMTMDEKIAFWQKVMGYAKGRNIDFYVVTWNIFVNGTNNKYGITDDINNETTRDYFRKSVRQLFLTYPDLKGIGLTTGENMRGATFTEKEDWAFDTYAQGVLDVVDLQPDRKVTFIHRQHMTGAQDIAKRFKPLIAHKNIEFIFSFKYAKAHVFSSTIQPWHSDFVREIGDIKTIWTLRNDDNYYFHWGDPDFVREFILNIPLENSRGFYYGSDQYIWGREFLHLFPETPRQLEIDKHWYHWMLWGRLGYDPMLGNELFVQILGNRFPQVDPRMLFQAWQNASAVYPLTTGFHWGALDFQWYIEGCKSRSGPADTPSGFHDINRFISLPPHPGTVNISIPDYVAGIKNSQPLAGTSPIDVSEKIAAHANNAFLLLEKLSPGGNRELSWILDDIRAMANLGDYYAHKIRAATELALFRAMYYKEHYFNAVREINLAATSWRRYGSIALSRYHNPLWTNRVGYVDWRDLFQYVLYDITIVGGEPELESAPPTAGGVIYEAEEARFNGALFAARNHGFTGKGYVNFGGWVPDRFIEWDVHTLQEGVHRLEFRYALAAEDQHFCPVEINGQKDFQLVMWTTGSENSWFWDSMDVNLKKGKNTIRLYPGDGVLVDHLNVFQEEIK